MIKEAFSFEDLLLVPQYSDISSRSEVDVSVRIRGFVWDHPIIAANMKSIMSPAMISEIIKSGGLAINHRFQSFEDQVQPFIDYKSEYQNYFGISVGVKDIDLEMSEKFIALGGKIICIDVAHGDSRLCLDMIKKIRRLPKGDSVLLIAGNAATPGAVKRLSGAGADVIKCGVGGGSICSTRINTGNGTGMMSMLMDIREELRTPIICDGGLTSSGAIVKSLCFADMVMAGSLFAGCKETPSQTVIHNGQEYKVYEGSSTHKTTRVEGVKAVVKPKGTYKETLTKLIDGIQSGCSYQGVSNLIDLKEHPEFRKLTPAAIKESNIHSIEFIVGE
jgi:IMP dehydrogenase/GMP reductase